jgi:hypothetical protein
LILLDCGTFWQSTSYATDSTYNVCLQIKTTSGDTCSYCHIIGKDSYGNIYREVGFTIYVSNPYLQTGIENGFQNENSFVVYPNPTNGVTEILFNRSLDNITIRVVNLTGQKVIEKTNLSGNRFSLDISQHAAGVYFVEILENTTILRSKLIKQ